MEENIHGQWLRVRFLCRQLDSLTDNLPTMDVGAITGAGGSGGGTSTTTLLEEGDEPESESQSSHSIIRSPEVTSASSSLTRRSILRNPSSSLESDPGGGRVEEQGPQEGAWDSELQQVRFRPKRKKIGEPGFYNEQRLCSSGIGTMASSSSSPDLVSSASKSGTGTDVGDKTGEEPTKEDTATSNKIKNKYYDVHEFIMEKEDKRIMPIIRLPLALIALIVILWRVSMLPTRCGLYAAGIVAWITYLQAWNTVVEETLLVISSLGIQVQQTNILGKLKYAKFVPVENVKAVIINEIIRRHRVIAYLLIILDSTESTGRIMVPLLIGTLPRLRTIERIYDQIQQAIF